MGSNQGKVPQFYDTTISDGLKIVQVWKVIDLRPPLMLGDVPSGFVWERHAQRDNGNRKDVSV